MNTAVRIPIVIAIVITICFQSCRNRSQNHPVLVNNNNTELYYEKVEKDNEIVDWDEKIPVFHHWRELDSIEYYFDVPSHDEEERWKTICEDKNQLDSASRLDVQGFFANMNQFVTVKDFYELWYHEDSYLENDDLTTWRLMQYDSLSFIQPDSEFDKFNALRNAIQGLLLYEPQSQWDMNFHSGLEADFQEYYDRVLFREAVNHSDSELADLLRKEQTTWFDYHAALDSAYRVIDGDPHGMVGSAWSMAICGIAYDDAQMRALSLEDFYFALTDSLDYNYAHKRSMTGEYEIERHAEISDKSVLREYERFMECFEDKTFFDPEYSYPVEKLKRALENEKKAWLSWMASRAEVSAVLSGLCKDCYDNSTNNVRRHKLIMLKNRYQGFGVTSQFILDCLLPYGCHDSEIAAFSFEENYKSK